MTKLLLNFGAKFQRSFTISNVKIQNCYGNGPVEGVEVEDEDTLSRTTAILEIFIDDTIENL